MSHVGRYRGQSWRRLPIGDIFPSNPLRSRWYFLIDDETNEPTGDHFPTLGDLQAFVDELHRCSVDARDLARDDAAVDS